jgi:hypothetical protein
MTETKILTWLLVIVATSAAIASVAALDYLRRLREKIRQHRDVRRMVTEASKPYLPFESGTHAKQR